MFEPVDALGVGTTAQVAASAEPAGTMAKAVPLSTAARNDIARLRFIDIALPLPDVEID
jgi:hypothetical protein